MNEKICDDRLDMSDLHDKIKAMSDEEFEKYLRTVEKEHKSAFSIETPSPY